MSVFAAFGAVVGAAHSAIEGLATLLTPLAGGLAGALAIVLFTLAVRLLISPLTYVQVRAERRRAALAPQIEKLRAQHRDDPMTLAAETIALQRAAGAGPFVTLLPGLAQAPFFMVMFRLVQPSTAVVTGLLAGAAFGVPLTAHLLGGLPVFAVLLALATLLAWWQSRRMRLTAADAPAGRPDDKPAGETAGKSFGESAGKPARELGGKPTVGPAGKPARRSTGKPERRSTGKPARESTGKPARESTGKPAGRSTGKPTPGNARKPTHRKPGKPARGSTGATAGEPPGARPDKPAAIARFLPLLPFGTVLVVAYLPLAGAIYLVTSTAWTALEHAIWRRPVIATDR